MFQNETLLPAWLEKGGGQNTIRLGYGCRSKDLFIQLSYRISSLLFLLIHLQNSYAQSSCKNAQEEARRNCAAGLQASRDLGPAPQAGPAITKNAATESVYLQRGLSALNSAEDYCRSQVKKCQQACGSNPNGQSPGGGNGQNEPCPSGLSRIRVIHTNDYICASPIAVQMGKSAIKMTSVDEGIWFDLLGENIEPAFTPVRTAWLAPESRKEVYFLSLPNADGQVTGINQLFGNNTKGPDQSFARNGYEALRP